MVNYDNVLENPDELRANLSTLKETGVDGIMVDVWWGIVEKNAPKKYEWGPYMSLFKLVTELGLKIQAIMSFHQCGGNVGDEVYIPLPPWVTAVADTNPNIFYTNKRGTRNPEYLSIGVDHERLFRGRTPLEVSFTLPVDVTLPETDYSYKENCADVQGLHE